MQKISSKNNPNIYGNFKTSDKKIERFYDMSSIIGEEKRSHFDGWLQYKRTSCRKI